MVLLAGRCTQRHQANPVLPPARPPPPMQKPGHASSSPHPVPPNLSCEPTPPHSLTPTSTSHLSPSPGSQRWSVRPQAQAWQPPGSSPLHLPPTRPKVRPQNDPVQFIWDPGPSGVLALTTQGAEGRPRTRLSKRRPLGWNSARSVGQTSRANGALRGWALETGRVGCSAQQAARLTHAYTPPLSTPASQPWEEETEAGGVRPSQGHPARGHLLFDPCAWHLPGGCSGVGPGPRSSQAASPQARPSCSPDLTGPPAVGSPGPLTSRVSVTDQGCVLWAISHPRPTAAHHQTQLWFSQERGPPTRAWTHGPTTSPRETLARYSLL